MTHFAPLKEMTLLKKVLTSVMSAVGVPMSSRLFIQLPPAVSLVQCVSVLFGFMLQLKLPYITSFLLLTGTWSCRMKKMVFVGFTLPPTPCANRPNSFADDVFHIFWCFGCLISC